MIFIALKPGPMARMGQNNVIFRHIWHKNGSQKQDQMSMILH